MSLLHDNAAPIERFGRTWKVWTKRQLIDMAARLPLSKIEQALVTYPDLLRYAQSAIGIDHALAVAGGIKESEVAAIESQREKDKLAGELIERFIGAYYADAGEEPSPPLAETAETGR